MMRYFGRFVVGIFGFSLIRYADMFPFWLDVLITLGGIALVDWWSRDWAAWRREESL